MRKAGDEILFKRRQRQCRFLQLTTQQTGAFFFFKLLLLKQLLKRGLCTETDFVAALSQSQAPQLQNLPSAIMLQVSQMGLLCVFQSLLMQAG